MTPLAATEYLEHFKIRPHILWPFHKIKINILECCPEHLAMYFSYTLSLFPMNRTFPLYVKVANMTREFTAEKEPIGAEQWQHWRPQCSVYGSAVLSQNESRVILLSDFWISSDSYEHILQFSDLGEKFSKRCRNRTSNPLGWRFSSLHPLIRGKSDCSAEHSQVTGRVLNETFYLKPELVYPGVPGQHEVSLKDTFHTS